MKPLPINFKLIFFRHTLCQNRVEVFPQVGYNNHKSFDPQLNAPLIDYSKLQQERSYKNFDGYFEFEKRIIWYYMSQTDWGKLYVYIDDFLKAEEQRDYLMRIEKYPDNYNPEECKLKIPIPLKKS